MSDVDSLRAQLRDRGYLTHGIERWFALDPWSSRTFWVELVMLAAKAALLIAAFGALPMTAVMVARNFPLGAAETLGLFVVYAMAWFVAGFGLIVAAAMLLKLRPALPIDTPRALLAISLAAGALLLIPFLVWWYRFDAAPALVELIAGAILAVAFLLVATIVVSAALLSFSIYEVHRVPAIHQKSRTIPMLVAAMILIALLFVPTYAGPADPPLDPMVVTSPASGHLALIAVDGMTSDILQSRPDIVRQFALVTAVAPIEGRSTTERWASLGTGVRTELHGVRSIEGIRFRGGRHVLQRVSHADVVLMQLAPLLRLARRVPLPPTVRQRDYVWEIFAERGMTSLAVNWWATAENEGGALHAVGTETIFPLAHGDPLRLDALASRTFVELLDREHPRFATVYLPALDVILNRTEPDPSGRLASSLRVLDGVARTVAAARERGYEVVLSGLPGEGQQGQAVVASTLPFSGRTAWDVAPALLVAQGFPLSEEMPGGTAGQRIATFGARASSATAPTVNQEYYDNLKSLGYIR